MHVYALVALFLTMVNPLPYAQAAKDDDTAVKRVGVEVGVDMCKAILDAGVSPGLHFYTLNLEKVVISILHVRTHTHTVPEPPPTLTHPLLPTRAWTWRRTWSSPPPWRSPPP